MPFSYILKRPVQILGKNKSSLQNSESAEMLHTIQQIQLKEPEGNIKTSNSAGKLSPYNTSCIITYPEMCASQQRRVLEARYKMINSVQHFEDFFITRPIQSVEQTNLVPHTPQMKRILFYE